MRHLLILGLLLHSLTNFCQTKVDQGVVITPVHHLGPSPNGKSDGANLTVTTTHISINWHQLGFTKAGDTLVINDLEKVKFIKIGSKVYQIVVPAPTLQEVQEPQFIFGTGQLPNAGYVPDTLAMPTTIWSNGQHYYAPVGRNKGSCQMDLIQNNSYNR